MRHSVITQLAAIALLLVVVIASIAYYRVAVVATRDNADKQEISTIVLGLRELQDASLAFKRIRVDIRDSILHPRQYTFYENRIVTLIGELQNHAKVLKEHSVTPEMLSTVAKLQAELATFYDVGGRILGHSSVGNARAATTLLLAECIPVGERIVALLQLLEEQYKNASTEALASLRASATTANRMTILNVVVSVLMLAVVIAFVYASIVRPVIRIKDEVGKLAQGDLTSAYQPLRGKSEIGALSRSLSSTIANLRLLVASVQSASQAVAGKALGLSSSIQEVAAGNSNQVSISKEISQTLEHLAGATQEIAANAQTASSAGTTASEAAQAGTIKIGSAIATLKTVQESVLSLSSVSNQIGGMAAVIDDIADQTNLLALNAAIEAARAGEHGRGFAVVADAVRSLAEQSRQSTKEIRALTATVLKQIDGAIALSTEGAEGAKGAQEALANITSKISDIALTIEGISAASEEQAAAANEVAASMDNFGSITSQVASSSQESAVSAQQLSDLAADLQRAASKFRL